MRQILRRIHPDRHGVNNRGINGEPGFQCAQLLELFALFKRRRRQSDKFIQSGTLVGINADMVIKRPLYHHIGIYAYQRAALDKFVALPPSPLEQREKLEQLRALEAGFTINAAIVDTVPVGVDTPEDLAHAEAVLKEQSL